MSEERGEKCGRWVVLIPFLIWAVSLVGFSFGPSGLHIPYSSHGDEFSLNLPEARENPGFSFDGSFPKYDSSNVERAGYWPYGPPRSVLAEGGYVYVGYGGGIWIFDVSEPDSPVVVGMVATPDLVEDMVYHDGVLYVANSYAGVTAIDVSDPEHPEVVGNCMYGREVTRVRIWYPYLFAKTGEEWGNIVVVDVSDPEDMEELGVEIEGGYVYDVEDGYLYKVTYSIMRVIDVHDPLEPVYVGVVDIGGMGSSDMEVEGGYAYISRDSGLWVIDVHDPESMYVVMEDTLVISLCRLDVESGYLYVVNAYSSGWIYDVTDPGNIERVGQLPVGGMECRISVGEESLYAVNYWARVFSVVDCSDVNNPEIIYENREGPDISADVDLGGRYCYYGYRRGGVYILDVSDVRNIRNVGHIGGVSVRKVRVDGDRLWLVDGEGNLELWDVSDVSEPYLLGSIWAGNVKDMEAGGPGYVYILVGDSMEVVREEGGVLEVVGGYEGEDEMKYMDAEGSKVYVADSLRVYILEVGDDGAVELVAEHDMRELLGGGFIGLYGLWWNEGYLYLGTTWYGYERWLDVYYVGGGDEMEHVWAGGGMVGDMDFYGDRACMEGFDTERCVTSMVLWIRWGG